MFKMFQNFIYYIIYNYSNLPNRKDSSDTGSGGKEPLTLVEVAEIWSYLLLIQPWADQFITSKASIFSHVKYKNWTRSLRSYSNFMTKSTLWQPKKMGLIFNAYCLFPYLANNWLPRRVKEVPSASITDYIVKLPQVWQKKFSEKQKFAGNVL